MRNTAFLLFLFSSCLALGASTRSFNAPKDRVFKAGLISAERQFSLLSYDEQSFTLIFMTPMGERSTASFTTDGDLKTNLVVTTTGPLHAWGNRSATEKSFLEGIQDSLDGKQVRVNKKYKEKAERMAERDNSKNASPASLVLPGTPQEVKSLLVSYCADQSFAIGNESEHQIVFFKDFAANAGVVERVLFGNYAPNAYRISLQFMLAPEGEMTKVSTAAEQLVQNGFGGVSRLVITNEPRTRGDLQRFLEGLKLRLEEKKRQAQSSVAR